MNRYKIKDWHNSSLFSWMVSLICCTIIFAAIELKYPCFFLRDDNATSYISVYTYGLRCLFEGKFPLYCFNTFGGERFFASGQTGLFNPLIMLAALVSKLICGKTDLIMDILAYMSIIIGCTGVFLLLKKLGCSDMATVIGAIAWNFNAYNIWVGTSWILIIYTTSVFPFFLLTSILLLEERSIRSLIFAVIPRVYLFYLGHPQFFIYAAIFDCVFIGVLCLVRNGKNRWHQLLRLVGDYLIVYVSTTFLALPLLIPEYNYTQLSLVFSSASSYEHLRNEMWLDIPQFFFPFLYTEDMRSFFYPPFVGYLLFCFLIAGFFLLVLIRNDNEHSKYKELKNGMFAALPCFVIAFFILFVPDTMRVISYIPILNRFELYHRISIFFSAFEVIIACLSMSIVISLIKQKLGKYKKAFPFIKYSVICAELLLFALLYTCTPHMGRGPLFDTSELYDYEFAGQFKDGRYLSVDYDTNDETLSKKTNNLSENLDYNLAKLYGINNISGYFSYSSNKNVLINNEFVYHMLIIKGSVYEYYPDLIEQMRKQSVCWYIVSPVSKADFESQTKNYGLEFVSETDHSVIYYDPYSEPYAYDTNGNEVNLVQDINSLILNTDNAFPGGKITLNYTYDPNFKCYIDGQSVPITDDAENWQFEVFCEPGEHSIEVCYEEPGLFIYCTIACGYLIVAGIATVICKKSLCKLGKNKNAPE